MRRPEDDLLLACATLYGGLDKAARIKELVRENIDWISLLHAAQRHGTLLLLYYNLKEVCPERIPGNIMDRLRNHFRISTVKHLNLILHLLKVLDLFRDHGISVIPYKGPTLDVLGYQDRSLRQFCDLDLIIHRRDVLKAKGILLAQGFQAEIPLSPGEESAYLQHECEYNFFQHSGGVMVELHWQIVQNYYACDFEINDLWDQLEPVTLLGREVLTISPEKLLLVLCLHHGGKHQWERLGWISDMAQLITTHKDMDWRWVMDRASHSGIERMLLLGLHLAKHMLAADLPDFVARRLQHDPSLEPLAAEVRTRIFNHDGPPPGEIDRLFFYLKMRERPGDKLRYLVRRLFTPTMNDFSVARLPVSFHAFYRLVRPIRLAWELSRK